MSVGSLVTSGPLLLAAPVAAAAGLVSFLSPCVLPLVPGYLSYVTGLSGADLAAAEQDTAPPPVAVPGVATAAGTAGVGVLTCTPTTVTAAPRPPGAAHRGRVAAGAGLFVLGFTAVFVSAGAAFGGLGRSLIVHQRVLDQVLGAVTVVFGLAFAGVFARVPLANREFRVHRLPARGLAGAPLLGVMFGVGWTPCLGPTLGAVQGLAIDSATAGRGAFLSAVYCLGLGVPFLVVAVAFRGTLGAFARFRRHARLLTVLGGAMLVVVGLLEVSGLWAHLVTELRHLDPGYTSGI